MLDQVQEYVDPSCIISPQDIIPRGYRKALKLFRILNPTLTTTCRNIIRMGRFSSNGSAWVTWLQ
jgi:hypothetical protein